MLLLCAEITNKSIAHWIILSVQVCFAGYSLIGSVAMDRGGDPFVFILYREVISSFLMVCYAQYHGVEWKIDRKHYLQFVLCGFLLFVNVVGALLALKFISSNRFSVFQPSIPCVATVVSIMVGLEKGSVLKFLGIGIAVGGAVLIETWDPSSTSGESNVPLGTIIVTAQVLAQGCLIVAAKPLLTIYKPAIVTSIYYTIGSAFTLLLCCSLMIYDFEADAYALKGDLYIWLALLYSILIATVYAWNAISWAGCYLNPSITTAYSTFQPVVTIILSLVILNVVITTSELVGGTIVCLGLIITVYEQYRESCEDYLLIKEVERLEDVPPVFEPESKTALYKVLKESTSAEGLSRSSSNPLLKEKLPLHLH